MGFYLDTILADDFVQRFSGGRGNHTMSESDMIEYAQTITDEQTYRLAQRVGTELSQNTRNACYCADVRHYMGEGLSLEEAVAKAQAFWDKSCPSIAGTGYPANVL
jgi:hypothetical protein